MKKILMALFLGVIALSSCDSDDDEPKTERYAITKSELVKYGTWHNIYNSKNSLQFVSDKSFMIFRNGHLDDIYTYITYDLQPFSGTVQYFVIGKDTQAKIEALKIDNGGWFSRSISITGSGKYNIDGNYEP